MFTGRQMQRCGEMDPCLVSNKQPVNRGDIAFHITCTKAAESVYRSSTYIHTAQLPINPEIAPNAHPYVARQSAQTARVDTRRPPTDSSYTWRPRWRRKAQKWRPQRSRPVSGNMVVPQEPAVEDGWRGLSRTGDGWREREIRGIWVRAEQEYEDSPALPTIVDYGN